jgi:hypothetical protein
MEERRLKESRTYASNRKKAVVRYESALPLFQRFVGWKKGGSRKAGLTRQTAKKRLYAAGKAGLTRQTDEIIGCTLREKQDSRVKPQKSGCTLRIRSTAFSAVCRMERMENKRVQPQKSGCTLKKRKLCIS